MSTEARTGGRWLVASFVILAAGGVALLLNPAGSPPAPSAGPAVPSAPQGPGLPPAPVVPFDWPDGPELDRTYELAPGEAFELLLDSGGVEVAPSEAGSARVRVSFVGGTLPPARFIWANERSEEGTRLSIRAQESRSWWSRLFDSEQEEEEVLVEGERVKVSGKRARVGLVQVWLPPDSPLHVRSGAGSIEAVDRNAPVSIDSGAGDVRLVRIAASVEVDTGAGEVHLEDVAGDATVDTGAGEVIARGVVGELDVDTGAGHVSFSGAPASVSVDTGAGGVDGELAMLLGPIDIDTGMGGIVLRLPAGSDAEIRAESGLGSVSAELEGTRLKARRGDPLTATLGEGGLDIRLRTGTGSIRISDAPATGSDSN